MKSKFQIGDQVLFSPIIGGKHDGKVYTVRLFGNVCGQDVAWLDGKSGCVAIAALKPYNPHLYLAAQ